MYLEIVDPLNDDSKIYGPLIDVLSDVQQFLHTQLSGQIEFQNRLDNAFKKELGITEAEQGKGVYCSNTFANAPEGSLFWRSRVKIIISELKPETETSLCILNQDRRLLIVHEPDRKATILIPMNAKGERLRTKDIVLDYPSSEEASRCGVSSVQRENVIMYCGAFGSCPSNRFTINIDSLWSHEEPIISDEDHFDCGYRG